MKVIAINGSPHKKGDTYYALNLMVEELTKEGIDVEVIQVGSESIHGCIGCGYCSQSEENQCIFKDDLVNETAAKMRKADGFILASPTYYAGIAGTMKSFLDRVFFTSSQYFKYKVATSVAVVRRAGGVEVVNQLNNYLSLGETVTPPSQYWTIAYGLTPGEILQDGEGVQTLRKNARAMAWLLKVIDASKGTIPLPQEEERIMTHFIR
ncbi:flavodoxin family protein [Sinanaerobacter chloroacetimidivorans]|uniref:Flavodoxin family protein n=1 Tax=Sinanaerobacter chloroacetimidivorans TaxID=2818044 RepID=A0A8J8B445_9FIRM|nr:flavodoxin family protein [Sinanaerobacter chloroacetimidivorans]MBR0600367.1 flavodoxin family protein [Sinanaerobacter chloroacetimidivorans]